MKVTLLERGRFIITTEDGIEHKGRFCAGAVDRFCSLNGIEHLVDFYAKVAKMLAKDQANMIICAMEYEQEIEGIYTTKQVLEWFDDMGGILSEQFTDLMAHEVKAFRAPEEKKIPEQQQTTKKTGKK